jgi:hypothetical protein
MVKKSDDDDASLPLALRILGDAYLAFVKLRGEENIISEASLQIRFHLLLWNAIIATTKQELDTVEKLLRIRSLLLLFSQMTITMGTALGFC